MEIFKLFGSIMVDNSKANQSIAKTEEHAETLGGKLGSGIKAAAKWGMAIGTAAVAVGGALFAVTNKAAETGDRIDKLSQKIGLSRESFQEWDYVLAQNGIEVERLQVGIKTMTDAMGGVGKGAEVFAALGISVTDSTGKMRSQEEVFAESVQKLQQIEDQTLKASYATDLFGKAGTELMPMLNQTIAGTDELIQRAHDLGLVMTDEAVAASVKFGDTLDDVKKSLGMIGTQIGVSLMPIFQKMLDWILENLPEIKRVVGTVFDFVSKILKGVFDVVGSVISILKPVLEFIGFALVSAAEVLEVCFGAIADTISAVSDAFDWLADKVEAAIKWLFKWNDTEVSEKKVTVKTSQQDLQNSKSHAGGLPFVPYDGYMAELHRGEKVLTKSQAEAEQVQIPQPKQYIFNLNTSIEGRQVGKAVYKFIEDQAGLNGLNLVEG